MTPLQIDILLWYYTRAVDYRDGDLSAPAVREAIDEFRVSTRLLVAIPQGDHSPGDHRSYRLTERGEAYVAALQSLPLPECRWVVPGFALELDH